MCIATGASFKSTAGVGSGGSWVNDTSVFSPNTPLFVGGATSQCGFIGDLFEVTHSILLLVVFMELFFLFIIALRAGNRIPDAAE